MLSIKNIRKFRTELKKRDNVLANLDEHMIGTYTDDKITGERTFGWFRLIHGITGTSGTTVKQGIRNYLLGFLNMAKDGQAAYEFLQNAVDERATHFAMLWGKDETDGNEYLIVANNGRMFNEQDVESILNIGASTKYASHSSIGKFGIGFKLAHRLVGKSDGLDELLDGYSGPVLFSWRNGEIQQLAMNEVPEVVSDDVDAPWLFKILLTCFPCMPQNGSDTDLPRLLDGQRAEKSPFGKGELNTLSRWVGRLLDTTGESDYSEGSLFFMKLGEGKAGQLNDKNLKNGLKFSMGILQENIQNKTNESAALRAVQLNTGAPIHLPDLSYERITIDPYESRSIVPDSTDEADIAIEYLIGYRPHHQIGNFFKGAPNFYLFFPLSEEVHDFNFILHCNAFDNSSSRTFLQEGTANGQGLNEQLFDVLVDRIQMRMHELIHENPERFLDLYAAFLTSGFSGSAQRDWINRRFTYPLNRFLKEVIPVQVSGSSDKFEILSKGLTAWIKDTDIQIDPERWGLSEYRWFYWCGEEFGGFEEKAASKLQLRRFTVYELLETPGVSAHLNEWMGNDTSRIDLVLKELSGNKAPKKKPEVIENLMNLRILEFTDGKVFSFNELDNAQDQGYLLLHNTLAEVRDLLLKVGFCITRHDFKDYDFLDSVRRKVAQLSGHTELVRLFSSTISDVAAKELSPDDKCRLYEAFRTLNDSPGERMPELKLFCNRAGNVVPLKNMLKEAPYTWLKPFSIDPRELNPKMDYFGSRDGNIYDDIVVPYWCDIADRLALHPDTAPEALEQLIRLFEQSNKDNPITHQQLVFFRGEVVKCNRIFFHEKLSEYPDETYGELQRLMHTHFNVVLPDQWFVPFLSREPFERDSQQLELKAEALVLTLDEVILMLGLAKRTGTDVFNYLVIREEDSRFLLSGLDGDANCSTRNGELLSYIETYHSNDWVPLPTALWDAPQQPRASGDVLVTQLIADCHAVDDEERQLHLCKALLKESNELRLSWLQSQSSVVLDTTWKKENANRIRVGLLTGLLTNEESEIAEELWKKAVLQTESGLVSLLDIHQLSNQVVIRTDEKEYKFSLSRLLNKDNQEDVQIVESFARECVAREWMSESQANRLFRLDRTDHLPVSEFRSVVEENEGQLTNADQLAFAILCRDIAQHELESFRVRAASGEWMDLLDTWLLPDAVHPELIGPDWLLHDHYTGLREVLQFDEREPLRFGSEDRHQLLSRFVFQHGCHIEFLRAGSDSQVLLEYLYEGWKLDARNPVSMADRQWEPLLKFTPDQCVVDIPHLKGEALPVWVVEWLEKDEKKVHFLAGLGVHDPKGRLADLRGVLLDEGIGEMSVELTTGISEYMLWNTLLGLANGFELSEEEGSPASFSREDERLTVIRHIQQKLAARQDPEFPVLIHRPAQRMILFDPQKGEVLRMDESHRKQLCDADPEALDLLYDRVNVLTYDEELEDTYASQYGRLPLRRELNDSGIEEQRDSEYIKWKQRHHIRLFGAESLPFRIIAELPDEDLSLGTIRQTEHHCIQTDDGWTEIYYLRKSGLGMLVNELEQTERQYADAVSELIEMREKLLGIIAANHNDELDRLMQKQTVEDDRRKYLDQLTATHKYSYDWFVAYLGYLETFRDPTDTTAYKSITFQVVERQEDTEGNWKKKHFWLRGAGQLIPESIDHFEDFTLSLTFDDKSREKLSIEGVSKKGQDLLVYSGSSFDRELLERLHTVKQAKIDFVPSLDLGQKLQSAFGNRGLFPEWRYADQSLPSIEFIYGPPGTGKTTRLARMIARKLDADPETRFLILTPTNKAADVLVKKLIEVERPDTLAYRIGTPTNPDMDELIYTPTVNDAILNNAKVLASTIHRLPYFKVADDENLRLLCQLNDHWDYVIIDEASMVTLPYVVFALMALKHANPNTHFIVAGDPKQIPPVESISDQALEELDLDDENIYKMLRIDSFDQETLQNVKRDRDVINSLIIQYRSVPEIGNLFSRYSYDGLLEHHRSNGEDPIRPLPGKFADHFTDPVTFIPFPIKEEDSLFAPGKLVYSSYHVYSALLAAEVVRKFDEAAQRSMDDRPWRIGLICPYKAHAMLTNKLVTAFGLSSHVEVHCDTIHGFQGDQCDLVLFTATPNNRRFTGHRKALLNKHYLYNVAVSRARDYLWVLYPDYPEEPNSHIRDLMDVCAEDGHEPHIVPASVVEREFLGRSDAIESANYFSGHDPINVYGYPEQHYFIKSGPTAIDIQLGNLRLKPG